MDRDLEWRAYGRLIQSIEPFWQEKRTEQLKIIGIMDTTDLAKEVVYSHNLRRMQVLTRANGD